MRFSQRYWWGLEPSGMWRRVDVSFVPGVSKDRVAFNLKDPAVVEEEQTAWSTPPTADCLKHPSNDRLFEELLQRQTAWSTPPTSDCLKHSNSRLLEALLQQQTAWNTPTTADCLKHFSDSSRLLEVLLQQQTAVVIRPIMRFLQQSLCAVCVQFVCRLCAVPRRNDEGVRARVI